jgi:hypothetical protein
VLQYTLSAVRTFRSKRSGLAYAIYLVLCHTLTDG